MRPTPAALKGRLGRKASSPTEFFHGPAGVPDFGHVPNLVSIKLHDVDVVCRRALASWGARAALTCMGRGENTVGADALSIVVNRKRFHLIASVRHKRDHCLNTCQRFCLRCETCIGRAIRFANLPAFPCIASGEKFLGYCRHGGHIFLLPIFMEFLPARTICPICARSHTLATPGIIDGPSPSILEVTPSATLVSSPTAASATLRGSAINAAATPSPTPKAVRLSILP